jgi:3-hydroxybutyryl-CoA dehydrogenase
MNILVIGDGQQYAALLEKGGLNGHQVLHELSAEHIGTLGGYNLVIDLDFDAHTERGALYAKHPAVPVLAGMVKTSLSTIMGLHAFSQGFAIIGCNWLQGFINMPVTEVSLMDEEQRPALQQIMEQLGWQYEVVEDRVGMVTPRVVCMIINEAYMAAEEGTASREDINTAMKLGTNYPYGPFEWCDRIGLQNVHAVLKAVHEATGNERYKISELLAAEASNGQLQN